MIEIDGRTRVCGLLGNPVEHTLSPAIHNMLSEELSDNMVYVPFRVTGGEEQVRKAVEGAYELNMLGMNVTVPHKEHVLGALREMDPLAEKIGAVNTLVRVDGGYKGYNTDMTGLYRAMTAEGIQIEGEDIILLGAGGAARAVAFLCASHKAHKVYLLNRTLEKAGAVAGEVNEKTGTDCITAMKLSDYPQLPSGSYLAIQGTNVGLYPNTEEAVITDRAFYEKIHTGYDLIYRPDKTRFMQLAEEAGGKACNGLKMLIYQAVIAYELWNNTEVSDELAEKVYEKIKEDIKGNA